MKTAYSFLRWSTKKQNQENRDSRKRQTESAEKWIAEHGAGEYALSKEIFIADGQSAYKGKHIEKDAFGKAKGELMRFVQKVEQGEIKNNSILLVDSIDRFTRLSAPQALTLFSLVLNTGIGLVFTGTHEKRVINNELLAKEPHTLYFIIGEIIRANTESSERGRKIKSSIIGKKELMRNGVKVAHNNLPKFITFNKTTKDYEFNDNAEVVKEIVRSVMEGKSLYSIANNLNKQGVKTFCRGYEWRGTNISELLKNRTITGDFLGIKGYLPPLIDEEKFDALQNVLKGNKFNRGKRGIVPNIFRGIAFCVCGRPMAASCHYETTTPIRYMRCAFAGENVKCHCRAAMNLASMEKDFFLNVLFKNSHDLSDSNNAEVKALDKAINAATTKVNKLQVAYEDLLDAVLGLKNPAIKIKLAELERDIEKANAEKDELILNKSRFAATPANAKAIMQKIGQVIDFDAGTVTPFYNENKDLRIESALSSNEAREKIRIMLPNVIGKMVVDTNKRQYFIYNHVGTLVYTSRIFYVIRNGKPAIEAYKAKQGQTAKAKVAEYLAKQ